MQSETGAIYELWEEEPLVFPPHSRLYRLEPIGLGRPMVESLTSFVTRLAEEHSVYPHVLVTDEILPLLNRPYLYQNGKPRYDHYSKVWTESPVLNGVTPSTRDWIRALEQLTLRNDLRFLTMFTFRDILPPRKLLRRTRAWCSICYEEWRNGDQKVYDPLLWTLEIVTTCPRHHRRLQLCCPYCHCTLPPLSPRAFPGYCTQCHRWLGQQCQEEGENIVVPGDQDWTWQQWVGNAMGEMLASAPSLSTPPSKEQITAIITAYVDNVAEGNRSVLAHLLQKNHRSVGEWMDGLSLPTLENLARMCFYFGVAPLCVFTGDAVEAVSRQRNISREDIFSERQTKPPRKFDIGRLRQQLEAVLRHEDPPLSMRQVAKRLGYDHSHLYSQLPELCSAISARYLAYRQAQGEQRRQKLCEEVRQAVRTLHQQGHYPSDRLVRTLLRSPRSLQEPVAYATWKETLKELGWTQ